MADSYVESTCATRDSSVSSEALLKESTCLVCQTVADAVTHWDYTKLNKRITLGDWSGFVNVVECRTCQQIVRHYADKPGMSTTCSLALSYSFDTFWISCLKQWRDNCEANHGSKCNAVFELQTTENALSLTLIDIRRLCLIAPKTPVRYVALSYVWGQLSGTLMAMTHNMDYLSTPGSLEAPETKSRIPRTIIDAIAVTKMMGIDYIWVDRLCIVQNNARHFNEQLQQMASIYSNACFTIIAADGRDANHGLHGIGGQALPRYHEQKYYRFSSTVKLLCNTRTESRSKTSSWYTRAWTFQERAVSRKSLVFVNNTVYWECRSMIWREDISMTPRSFSWRPDGASADWPSYAFTPHPWPDLKQYCSLVCGYNNRSLSFESDALKAFTAIINAFSRSFRSGFLFGVPEFLFDVGLLWSTSYPLKRRKDFPSWSWVGWSGNIEFEMTRVWQPDLHSFTRPKIWPVVRWEKIRNEDQTHVQIDNSYHIYRNMQYDLNAVLPQGWTRSRDMFTCDDPSIQGRDFYFPFPIPAGLAAPNADNWSRTLTFRAEKCTVFLGRPCVGGSNEPQSSKKCLHLELKDQCGSLIGVIESTFTREQDYIQGDHCELIAISRSRVLRIYPEDEMEPEWQPFQEMNSFLELKDAEVYDFYNVLWIEWEDGIAYRKALGRVMKDAWKRQDPQITDILLG